MNGEDGTRQFDAVIVLGSDGRLGSALSSAYGQKVIALGRAKVAEWASCADVELQRLIDAYPKPSLIHCAFGIVDPRAGSSELMRVNCHLPLRIARAAPASCRIVTFGTVMERILPPRSMNPYVFSKNTLAEQLRVLRQGGRDTLHLNLHTLYGGRFPHPGMFAGQMFSAIREQRDFEMSSGRQIREYHHVDDEAAAIIRVAAESPPQDFLLSSQDPIRLGDLATKVFAHFGMSDRLKIGAIAGEEEDFFEPLAHSNLTNKAYFRPPIAGVIEWFTKLMNTREISGADRRG